VLGINLKYKKIFDFGFDIKNPDYNIPKFALICIISLIFILIFFSFINFTINNNKSLAFIELFLSIIAFGVVVYYKKYKNIESFLLATTTLIFIVTITFYFNSAKTLFSSVWLFFFPLSVFLLNGLKIGKVFTIVYVSIIIVDTYNNIGVYTNFVSFLNLSVGLVLFSILAYFFEHNRKEAFNKMVSKNNELVSISNENIQLLKSLKNEVELNENLLKENKRFIADTVHQIRTPLSNIMMNSDMIRIVQKDESANEFIDQIDASINMLTNSYEDLSYITSHDSIIYNPTSLCLSDILNERILFFSTIAKVNKKNILSNIDENIKFTINQIELERLIDNNISNAIKYASVDKFITIDMIKHNSIIELCFCSFGDSIKDSSRLFEKNYRENESKRGLGIGLNMVKSICEKYNILYEVSYKKKQNIFRYKFR